MVRWLTECGVNAEGFATEFAAEGEPESLPAADAAAG
jgi:hypothetical protein